MAGDLVGGLPGLGKSFSSEAAKPFKPSLPMRVWAAIPEWVFRLVGCLFFLGYLLARLPDYFQNFWGLGPYYIFADGTRISLPWTRVLVDLTCLLIALSYIFRAPAKSRNTSGWDVLMAMLGSFWPLFPFVLGGLLAGFAPQQAFEYQHYLWRSSLTFTETFAGATLMIVGSALDIWGYGILFRSFSIVPEARELKATGPYRLLRHPIYFGQILGQAGIWLCFARLSIFSISFLLAFVAIQLYRSKLEDRVLGAAFGERYLTWKARTFWFV